MQSIYRYVLFCYIVGYIIQYKMMHQLTCSLRDLSNMIWYIFLYVMYMSLMFINIFVCVTYMLSIGLTPNKQFIDVASMRPPNALHQHFLKIYNQIHNSYNKYTTVNQN